MKILFLYPFFILFTLFFLPLQAKDDTLVAYSKNCAVTPDGALVEEVWQVIPYENIFFTQEKKIPALRTTVKAVYEKTYLCIALKMEMERKRIDEALLNKKVDFVDVVLKSEAGKIFKFHVTPLWITSSWKQDKINASGVRRTSRAYTAEVRIPMAGKDLYYSEKQTFALSITRSSLLASGKWEKSLYKGTLLLGKLAYTDNTPRRNTKLWRNGNMNTFFKRPNRRWNSNWDLGEGDYLQQGWNLNKAKGLGYFEVLAHEDKKDDYYVLLRNGDFYQVYKGLEKEIRYSFQAKGKGILKVRFLRFAFQGLSLQFKGVHSEKVIHLDSDQWKTYSGIVKKRRSTESLALDFSTENSYIMLDEAYMKGIK